MTKVEFSRKLVRIRKFLNEKKQKALVLSERSSFAWATCGGDSHIVYGSSEGGASFVSDGKAAWILTNNIEAPRLKKEEIAGLKVQWVVVPWQDPTAKKQWLLKQFKNLDQLIFDNDSYGYPRQSVWPLFAPLLDSETERYVYLGKTAASAVEGVCMALNPGLSETEVAGRVAWSLIRERILPVAVMVGSDDRLPQFRHPIETQKKIGKLVMVVVCAQQSGLIVSFTRLIHFGKLPEELLKKHQAVMYVDALMNLSSRPGTKVGDVFRRAQKAYEETGFPGEWQNHHQGGPTGYFTRDYVANTECEELLVSNRAVAWNPSIKGTKSEDTFLVQKRTPTNLTRTKLWPYKEIVTPLGTLERPEILES